MTLTLRVKSYQGEKLPLDLQYRFDQRGGTVGRSKDCSLALDDPSKYLSRTHAQIVFQADQWLWTDVGANPTLINERPLSQGRQTRLSDGDLLTLGDYLVEVQVAGLLPEAFEAAPPAPTWSQDGGQAVDKLDDLADVDFLNTGYSKQVPKAPPPAAPSGQIGLARFGGSQFDHHPAAYEAMPLPPATAPRAPPQAPVPPVSAGRQMIIPEDEFDFLSPDSVPPQDPPPRKPVTAAPLARAPAPRPDPVAPAPQAPPQAPPRRAAAPPAAVTPPAARVPPATTPPAAVAPPAVQAEPPRPAAARPKAPANGLQAAPEAALPVPPAARQLDILAALLDGLGLDEASLSERANGAELAREVGQVLRLALEGTMHMLRARDMTKSGMDVETTLMQERGNNPLRFFPDVDMVLAQMFFRKRRGYLDAEEAVAKSFDDMKQHEIATLAGLQGAVMAVIEQFDPAVVDSTLTDGGLADRLGGRKGRLWDAMVERHRRLARAASEDFHQVVGDAFASAYSAQIEKLSGKANQ